MFGSTNVTYLIYLAEEYYHICPRPHYVCVYEYVCCINKIYERRNKTFPTQTYFIIIWLLLFFLEDIKALCLPNYIQYIALNVMSYVCEYVVSTPMEYLITQRKKDKSSGKSRNKDKNVTFIWNKFLDSAVVYCLLLGQMRMSTESMKRKLHY